MLSPRALSDGWRRGISSYRACISPNVCLALPGGMGEKRNRKEKDGQNNGRGKNEEHHGDLRRSVVPEANTGWVLLPFLGVVLLFSAPHLFRAKATE